MLFRSILKHSTSGEVGYEIIVGGGLGRTPMIGKVIRDFLPKADLLPYLEAVMRVYNAEGRRDNKYKARVKILIHEAGIEEIRKAVEEEFAASNRAAIAADPKEVQRINAYFSSPTYETLPEISARLEAAKANDPELKRFIDTNGFAHKVVGYVAITVSLKEIGRAHV